jgi:hypothetical protein
MTQKLRETSYGGPPPALPHPCPTPAAPANSPWCQPPPRAPSSKATTVKFTVPVNLPPKQEKKARGPPNDDAHTPLACIKKGESPLVCPTLPLPSIHEDGSPMAKPTKFVNTAVTTIQTAIHHYLHQQSLPPPKLMFVAQTNASCHNNSWAFGYNKCYADSLSSLYNAWGPKSLNKFELGSICCYLQHLRAKVQQSDNWPWLRHCASQDTRVLLVKSAIWRVIALEVYAKRWKRDLHEINKWRMSLDVKMWLTR